ncbi:MAG: carbonic anhydrase [Ignavibacteria bacterium]|nr:carbonic anhydrase [Ignavibacteria bacterium]
MERLISISSKENILSQYQNTPIGDLLEYHNLRSPFRNYTKAELLIGMCMDNRKRLNIPDNFAFIIRTGGANLRYSEFKVSFAIAIGGVKAITLIGHTNCGMVNLISKREQFVEGMMHNAGWTKEKAEEHFMNFAPMFEIENEIDFVAAEAKRLRTKYPSVLIAPMIYRTEDNLLYLVKE